MSKDQEIKLLLDGINTLAKSTDSDALGRYQNLVSCLLKVLYKEHGVRSTDTEGEYNGFK